jgi:hypothetical protein
LEEGLLVNDESRWIITVDAFYACTGVESSAIETIFSKNLFEKTEGWEKVIILDYLDVS